MFHEQALFSVSHHWSLEGSTVQLFSWILIVEKYLNDADLKKKERKKKFLLEKLFFVGLHLETV